jgi:hypothetical protein
MLKRTTLAIVRGIGGLAMDVSADSGFYLYSSFGHGALQLNEDQSLPLTSGSKSYVHGKLLSL